MISAEIIAAVGKEATTTTTTTLTTVDIEMVIVITLVTESVVVLVVIPVQVSIEVVMMAMVIAEIAVKLLVKETDIFNGYKHKGQEQILKRSIFAILTVLLHSYFSYNQP